jgi:hypothetical protein
VFYDYSLKIPLNTPKRAPEEQEIYLPPGVIHRIEIGFPAGARHMVYIAMRHGLNQLWPTNADGSFNADNYTIVINEHYVIKTEPFILTLQGWSPGTSYKHIIEVRFGILPEEVLAPEETFIQAFKKLLKRLRL